MIKKFYILVWILLAAAVALTFLTGSFTPVAAFVYGLVALALVHTLAMWSVIINTRDLDSAQET